MNIKRLALVLVLTIAAFAPHGVPHSLAANCDGDTVGLWKFDDGVGAIATETCGPASDGILNGQYWWVYPGAMGNAVHLGTNDPNGHGYMEASDIPSPADPFTVEFWIRRYPERASDVIMAQGSGDLSCKEWEIGLDEGRPSATIYQNCGSPIITITGGAPLDFQWHHVALTYDPSGWRHVALWVDCQVVVSATPLPAVVNGYHYLRIGASDTVGLIADVDELRISTIVREEHEQDCSRPPFVGGIAELPGLAAPAGSSGVGSGTYAVLAGAAAGVLAFAILATLSVKRRGVR